jgi:hypothetical protein
MNKEQLAEEIFNQTGIQLNGGYREISKESFTKAVTKIIDRLNSCDKSCGPGDYMEGGKCDENGCYNKAIQQPEGGREVYVPVSVEDELPTDSNFGNYILI